MADVAAAHAARRCVAEHHGQTGAALLRPGEHVLTAQRIIDYGRAARSPASPTVRAAAKATLVTQHARRRGLGYAPEHRVPHNHGQRLAYLGIPGAGGGDNAWARGLCRSTRYPRAGKNFDRL